MGVVIRDAAGNIIATCCKYLQGRYLVEEVEGLAMECGLLLAKEQMIPQIILESDGFTVVSSVVAADINGCFGHIYQGIRSLLASFSSWDIKHVRRDYNKVAHVLAHFARQWELSQVSIGVCPPMLSEVIQSDCMSYASLPEFSIYSLCCTLLSFWQ